MAVGNVGQELRRDGVESRWVGRVTSTLVKMWERMICPGRECEARRPSRTRMRTLGEAHIEMVTKENIDRSSFLKGLRLSPLQLRETAVGSRGSRALAP